MRVHLSVFALFALAACRTLEPTQSPAPSPVATLDEPSRVERQGVARISVEGVDDQLLEIVPDPSREQFRWGWSERRIYLSHDAGKSWRLWSTAPGVIEGVVISMNIPVLETSGLVRTNDGQLWKLTPHNVRSPSKNRLLDQYDYELARSRVTGTAPPANPAACLDASTEGEVELSTEVSNCTGGNTSTVRLKWNGAEVSFAGTVLTASGPFDFASFSEKRRPMDPESAKWVRREIIDIVANAERTPRCLSTVSASTTLKWRCGGASADEKSIQVAGRVCFEEDLQIVDKTSGTLTGSARASRMDRLSRLEKKLLLEYLPTEGRRE